MQNFGKNEENTENENHLTGTETEKSKMPSSQYKEKIDAMTTLLQCSLSLIIDFLLGKSPEKGVEVIDFKEKGMGINLTGEKLEELIKFLATADYAATQLEYYLRFHPFKEQYKDQFELIAMQKKIDEALDLKNNVIKGKMLKDGTFLTDQIDMNGEPIRPFRDIED